MSALKASCAVILCASHDQRLAFPLPRVSTLTHRLIGTESLEILNGIALLSISALERLAIQTLVLLRQQRARGMAGRGEADEVLKRHLARRGRLVGEESEQLEMRGRVRRQHGD
jgi:hypothetical protein